MSAWTDVGRGTAWGALSGAAYGVAFGVVVALDGAGEGLGAALAGSAVASSYAGIVGSLAGLVLGTLTAVCALAVAPWLRPAVGGPVTAAVLWTLPWLITGTVDPRGSLSQAGLFYALPLVLGCLGAWWWGEGVDLPEPEPPH
ncbi:MAG: hypothetical protein JWM64_2184 [Frankiales bacterium]|nr:hypothetical protein [Frankiales bacterium]